MFDDKLLGINIFQFDQIRIRYFLIPIKYHRIIFTYLIKNAKIWPWLCETPGRPASNYSLKRPAKTEIRAGGRHLPCISRRFPDRNPDYPVFPGSHPATNPATNGAAAARHLKNKTYRSPLYPLNRLAGGNGPRSATRPTRSSRRDPPSPHSPPPGSSPQGLLPGKYFLINNKINVILTRIAI